MRNAPRQSIPAVVETLARLRDGLDGLPQSGPFVPLVASIAIDDPVLRIEQVSLSIGPAHDRPAEREIEVAVASAKDGTTARRNIGRGLLAEIARQLEDAPGTARQVLEALGRAEESIRFHWLRWER